MSERTSLYRHFDKDGRLLYVGVSLSAISRLAQHRDSSHWFSEIASVNVEWFESRELALAAERVAVAKEKPLHNRMLRREEKLEPPPRAVAAVERPLLRLNPLYRLAEAADLLCMSTSRLRTLLDAGQIGAVEISPPRVDGQGRVSRYHGITGWQIIEYLECLENRSRKVA